MRIDILTCVPELVRAPLQHSILQRAVNKEIVQIVVHNLHDYGIGKHKQTDDYPYSGGAGMVMRIEPIAQCIRQLQSERKYDELIFLTPDGETLVQPTVNQLSLCTNLLMLAGHFKGIDQRVRELFITKEISVGDYVLTGGELPALLLTDAIVRLLPGVLSDETSALMDSFQDGLLEAPIYTRPASFEGMEVPEILLSGNFKKIEEWQIEQALLKTKIRRPDLFKKFTEQNPSDK